MSVTITQTVNNGDGTWIIYGRRPGGQVAHVIAGLDQLKSGAVYDMLEIAAKKLDAKAALVGQQSMLDSRE